MLDVDKGKLPQTQTGDVGTSICPSASPEISGADVKLSISVSECGLILGRHCEMAEDLDHGAGRSAHTGRSWSINQGPLVRPWSAGATTSPSIHAAALRVLMLERLRSPCSAPNGLESASLVTTAQPTRRMESCDKLVRLSVILTFIDFHRPWCRSPH